MELKVFVYACWLVAMAECKVNINEKIDKFLDRYRENLEESGRSMIPSHDLEGTVFNAKGTFLEDLTTIKRLDDTIMYNRFEMYKVYSHIGLGKAIIRVKELEFSTKELYNVSLEMTDFVIHLELEFNVTADDCSMRFSNYTWASAGRVTMHTDDEAFDGMNVSSFFTTIVIPYSNKIYKSSKFLSIISEQFNLCPYALQFLTI